jgi:hypothetical protein
MSMIGRLIALAVCLVAVAGLYFVVAEQRQDPEERVTIYEPGTYLGAPDTPLDPAQQEELRARVGNQSSI